MQWIPMCMCPCVSRHCVHGFRPCLIWVIGLLTSYIKLVFWHEPKSVMHKSQGQQVCACERVGKGTNKKCVTYSAQCISTWTHQCGRVCALLSGAGGFVSKHMAFSEGSRWRIIPLAVQDTHTHKCTHARTHTNRNNPVLATSLTDCKYDMLI